MASNRSYGRVDTLSEPQSRVANNPPIPNQNNVSRRTPDLAKGNHTPEDDDILIMSESGDYVPVEQISSRPKRKRSTAEISLGSRIDDTVDSSMDTPSQRTRKKTKNFSFERQMTSGNYNPTNPQTLDQQTSLENAPKGPKSSILAFVRNAVKRHEGPIATKKNKSSEKQNSSHDKHKQRFEKQNPPEPDFSTFVQGISPSIVLILGFENPCLPPLCDPELFDHIFLQNLYHGQSNFMRRYGDSLLRTMTYDVFGELLGRQNNSNLFGTMDFAVSNAFYEKILQHYGLESLSLHENGLKSGKTVTVQRGDVLEAYMAGVETDVSRCGDGYREIHTWLYKILSLRLGKATSAPVPMPSRPDMSNADGMSWNLRRNSDRRDTRTTARNIWWDPKTESNPNPQPVSVRERQSQHNQLIQFRQSLFDKMCGFLKEVHRTMPSIAKAQKNCFWMVFKYHLDGLRCDADETGLLVHYYRVTSS